MLISDAITLVRDDLADEGETPRITNPKGLRQFMRAVRAFASVIANEELPLGVKTYLVPVVQGQTDYPKPDDILRPLILSGANPGGLLWVDAEQWARMSDRPPVDVWTIFNDKIQVAGKPTKAENLTLYYYPTIPTQTYSGATVLPWGGAMDDALIEFVKIRWMSIDEYGISQDAKLAEGLTKSIITSLRPLQQAAFKGNFPEYI